MFLIAAIVIAAAVGASQPKAVKKVGHATACVVTFKQLKSCKTTALATAPARRD